MLGYGRLQVSGNLAFDGVNWFKILSPNLKRRKLSEAGWFIVLFNLVVFFKRDRKMIAHYINLGETYCRGDLGTLK